MNKLQRITDIALPVIGGSIVGLLTTQTAKEDFEKYNQPLFSPPKEAFGIVWPILYTTMGIAPNYYEAIAKRYRGKRLSV